MMRFLFIFLLFCISLGTGCQQDPTVPTQEHALLVTNSTFESAAREFMSSEELFIARLSEPGTCPGHFDIVPSQAVQIRQCPVAVRFNFQASLDAKLKSLSNTGEKKIKVIENMGGLCMPESYLHICRSMGEILQQEGWISTETLDAKMDALQERMALLEEEIRHQMQPLQGKAVLTSPHQKLFCQWLGLEVVATFNSSDAFTLNELSDSLHKGNATPIAFVIANEPEGNRVADLLAQELKTRRVTFGNFPALDGEHPFDTLLRNNLSKLFSAS